MSKWPERDLPALIIFKDKGTDSILIRDYRSWELVAQCSSAALEGHYECGPNNEAVLVNKGAEALGTLIASWLANPPPDTGPNPADPEYCRSLLAKEKQKPKAGAKGSADDSIDIDDILSRL